MTKKIPPGKGGSPGQPYDAPKEDPKNPYVPAPKKLVKKPRKRKAIPGRPGSEDRIHGEDYKTDIPYGYLATGTDEGHFEKDNNQPV